MPESVAVYPLLENPFVVVIRPDDALGKEHNTPWWQQAKRDFALFLKGNISRVVTSKNETHCLN